MRKKKPICPYLASLVTRNIGCYTLQKSDFISDLISRFNTITYYGKQSIGYAVLKFETIHVGLERPYFVSY